MSQSLHLLVVEDEPDLLALMEYHLVRAGYHVTTASSGWEAIQCVRWSKPDLILLDLMLPDLDGFGVCEILRHSPTTATIPIFIVSAWASNDSRNLGLELGAIDYLTKPFSPAELVRRLNTLLHARAS
jgi:two-component system, OmpR family, alkaline phosphatase synthesis response regulator PhoP